MAPGGIVSEDAVMSPIRLDDNVTETSNTELKDSSFTKYVTRTAENLGTSSGNDVRDLLVCPVCMSLMYPPIYQCQNGHTLCSNCKDRVRNSCPTCRGELGNIRCLALEKVAESLEFPCKYQIYGGYNILAYCSKLKHEKNCKYHPFNCPCAGAECSVTGDIPLLVRHLKNDHTVFTHDGCTFSQKYVKSNPQQFHNAKWILRVVNCFGRHFCLHFEAFQLGMSPVYIAFLRFMGNQEEAEQFSYSLEVGGSGRKLTWQGIPRSIRDSHKEVRDSLDGLIIQKKLALFFSGGDMQELNLRLAGRIWKENL